MTLCNSVERAATRERLEREVGVRVQRVLTASLGSSVCDGESRAVLEERNDNYVNFLNKVK